MTPFGLRKKLKSLVRSVLGMEEKPFPAPPPRPAGSGTTSSTAKRPPPRPPAPSVDDDRGHDHGHSHDHGHDHGHSHGHAEPPPQDRGQDHGHDHGHNHDHGGAPATAAPVGAAPSPSNGAGVKSAMWVQAGRLENLPAGQSRAVDVFGSRYALHRVGDDVFATANSCPHSGGPLGEGDLDGHEVTCPFHGWSFDVRTGRCTSGPQATVACVDVKLEEGRIMVRV